VRNLPACLAGAAFHAPVAPTRAVLDLQDDLEHSCIGLGGELALPRVATGLRIERVQPITTVVDGIAVILASSSVPVPDELME
jgi:hypothetical protein